MTATTPEEYGFIGLGQMGGPMAANIAAKGFPLTVYDRAGTQGLAPDDTKLAADAAGVARAADTVFLSVPDERASHAVLDELIAVTDRRCGVVIDLSTIGPAAAREAAKRCADAGLVYIDAPVSGGRAGAIAATIAVMLAGPSDVVAAHDAVLRSFAKNPFHVGKEPGQGQALKILNNFLSGTAMTATSEAILYGVSQGLDMKVMLDVLNAATGRNTATEDKFPKRVLTGTFHNGFATALQNKDVQLYLENAKAAGTPTRVGQAVADLWSDADEAMPGSDIMFMYKFLRGDPFEEKE